MLNQIVDNRPDEFYYSTEWLHDVPPRLTASFTPCLIPRDEPCCARWPPENTTSENWLRPFACHLPRLRNMCGCWKRPGWCVVVRKDGGTSVASRLRRWPRPTAGCASTNVSGTSV